MNYKKRFPECEEGRKHGSPTLHRPVWLSWTEFP